ncbi:MAG: DUF4365 domain-containing protein [Nanoarchaeota archaeon]|nr:DUF4365 domain-containing protein [Nanoarchaeota archaeon]
MKRIIKAKAAPYPKTNTKELEAVITFESLIDPNRIKPDIKIFDKIPNTDGLIEIVDLEQIPIGKIEIQIKYLNPYNYKTPKYQCDKKFLAYCEGSLLPVLLILVNTKNKIAYWHHIDKKTLISISDSILEKESISIHFSKKNFVSKKKHEYIESWIKIINNQKKKIFDYDKLENRFRQLHEEYSNINKKKLAKKAKENSIFKELHIFLDYYNNLLDGDFKTIKTILYPFYWKIGIGIIEYKETSISFILYPVRYDHNDTLIKEIGTKTRLKKEFISIVGHYYKNPIKTYPKKYSYELIEKNIENSLKQQPILPKEKIVAIEYLFAFIDKYYKLLDLDLKNKYTVTEIHNSLNNFLPLLIHLLLGFR